MEIFLCDNCDTLSTVTSEGNLISVIPCACANLFNTPEAN